MTDARIAGWIASHHYLIVTLLLAVVGTLAGFVQLASAAGFGVKHPRLAAVAKALQLLGIDLPTLGKLAWTILTGASLASIHDPPPTHTSDTPPMLRAAVGRCRFHWT